MMMSPTCIRSGVPDFGFPVVRCGGVHSLLLCLSSPLGRLLPVRRLGVAGKYSYLLRKISNLLQPVLAEGEMGHHSMSAPWVMTMMSEMLDHCFEHCTHCIVPDRISEKCRDLRMQGHRPRK